MQKAISGLFSIDFGQRIKALWIAVSTALLAYFYNVYVQVTGVEGWQLNDLYLALIDWKPILKLVISTAGTYLGVTLLSNNQGKFLRKDKK